MKRTTQEHIAGLLANIEGLQACVARQKRKLAEYPETVATLTSRIGVLESRLLDAKRHPQPVDAAELSRLAAFERTASERIAFLDDRIERLRLKLRSRNEEIASLRGVAARFDEEADGPLDAWAPS